jgi:hypothetical protein
VSISSDYCDLSRQLLVEFLRSHCLDPLLAQLVRPAHPVPRGRMVQTLAAEVAMLSHLDALAALVEDIEPDRKGVPVLLRQYLKLGGRMLAFNVDPAFKPFDRLFADGGSAPDGSARAAQIPARARRRASRPPSLPGDAQSRLTPRGVIRSYAFRSATGFNIPSMNCHLGKLPWRPTREGESHNYIPLTQVE